MSATIYFEPLKRKRTALPLGAPSSFMDMMQKGFGLRLPVLGKKDLDILRGMLISTSNPDVLKSVSMLMESIGRYGEIELTAEY